MSDVMLPLHLLSLVFVTWNIIRADHLGFMWIRGKESVLNAHRVHTYHTRLWIGLGLMILTGSFLFWPLHEYLLTRPQFYVKMGFVVALSINGCAIGTLQKQATTQKFSHLTLRKKSILFISGAISTLSWAGAAVAAFYLLPE